MSGVGRTARAHVSPPDVQTYTWQDRQDGIFAWSSKTFPTATVQTSLAHLQREVVELREDPHDLTEWADCLILLMDAATHVGFDMQDLAKAVDAKMLINRQRKWGPPDEDGVCSHIEAEQRAPCGARLAQHLMTGAAPTHFQDTEQKT